MNHVFLTGEIRSKPESFDEERSASLVLVTEEFSLPCQRSRRDWHRIVCRGTYGEFALRYLAPGDRVTATGKLRSESTTAAAVIEVEELELVRVRSLSPPGDDGAPIRIALERA